MAFIAGLVGATTVFSVQQFANHQSLFSPPEQREAAHRAPSISLVENNQYTFLRDADFMGNHFTVLRHNPTSQRVIFLAGQPDREETYASLYHRTLSPVEFKLLLELFKRNSSFEGKDISVNNVTLKQAGQLKGNGFALPYKHYLVNATVSGQSQPFDVYLGQIMKQDKTLGLVLTFNTNHHTQLSPLADMTAVLKNTTTELSNKPG